MSGPPDLPDEERRRLLQAGGALVIGLSLGACVAPREPASQAARSDSARLRDPVARPPDAAQLDTCLAIHADNTATPYIGFAPLGHGATTAPAQGAAQELD